MPRLLHHISVRYRNSSIWTGFRTADVPYAARFSGLDPVLS